MTPYSMAHPEDHELRRLDRRNTDLADNLTSADTFPRVRLGIALDVERLVRTDAT